MGLDQLGPGQVVVGAAIGDRAILQGQETAFPVEGKPHLVALLLGMGCAQEVFLAILDPAHRATQRAGQQADQQLLGMQVGLLAEPAPHIGDPDLDQVLRDSAEHRHHGPDETGHLGGRPQDQLLGGPLVLCNGAPGFHRASADPPAGELSTDDPGAAGENRRQLIPSTTGAGYHIAGQGVVGPGLPLQGRLDPGHGGKLLVLDLDELGGVFGDSPAGGHYDGDHLADETGNTVGKQGLDGRLEALDLHGRDNALGQLRHIGPVPDEFDAGQRLGVGDINGDDPGMGERAAQ
ncbi:hypothetical protein D3C84_510460 [compost metagenome]